MIDRQMYIFILIVQCLILINAIIFYLAMQVLDNYHNKIPTYFLLM